MLKRARSAAPAAETFQVQSPAIFRLAAALLVAAMLLGGRSAGTPVFEGLMRILAVWLLVMLAIGPRFARESALTKAAIGLMLATLILLGLQLLPLPYELWASLSGAPLAASVLEQTGLGGGWRPLTLNVDATRDALLTLLPPFALFLAMLDLDEEDRRRLALIALALAAFSVVIGLLQYATRTGFYPYKTTHQGYSVGIFSNRNHQADLSLICLLLASAFVAGIRASSRKSGPGVMIGALVIAALVALNLLAGASRTGILLGVPAFLVAAALASGAGGGDRGRALLLGVGALAVLGVVFVAVRPDLFAELFGRFSTTSDDTRFESWPDIVRQIQAYFPWGSGLGTFVPVFNSVENLNYVSERYLNNAHNDYLEIALEAGLIGILLVLASFALFAWAAYDSVIRRTMDRSYRALCIAAVSGIGVLLAHSAVDYSLRTSTLAVTFALLFGLLMPLPAVVGRERRRTRRR